MTRVRQLACELA